MDQLFVKTQPLHLRPRSRDTQRIWYIGETPTEPPGESSTDLRLAVLPGQHDNFASLKAILAQLMRYAAPEHLSQIVKLNGYLRQILPELNANGDGTVGKFLADSVSFAIMRRISRESVYTARIIDLGARTINAVLSQIPNCARVRVEHVDRIDRPTLKVLARAMLLLEPAHGFSWLWHSASDPTRECAGDAEDLFVASRSRLLLQLVRMLSPMMKRHREAVPLIRPEMRPASISLYDVSVALVMQNYDACFLWCDSFLRSNTDTEVAEGLRLRALAAVNIGDAEQALRTLRLAEGLSVQPGRRAHLSYLQGLIEAKRLYDLSCSTAHYERGLSALNIDVGKGEDLPLERAWLFNGIALNEAILWRRNPAVTEHYTRAFALERDAFSLVCEGDDPARTYLRFNLLANSGFLLEMQGRYDSAIDLFRKAFDLGADVSSPQTERWASIMGYRIGVLYYRARRLEEAYRFIKDAAQHDVDPENWATHERVLRALGTVAFELRAFPEASTVFTRGLDICRGARSAEGFREHARGLIAVLISTDKRRQAQELCDALQAEEGLEIVSADKSDFNRVDDDFRLSSPSPKLPAYIPEIDLEGIPAIDLNRFLSKARSEASPVRPWRS